MMSKGQFLEFGQKIRYVLVSTIQISGTSYGTRVLKVRDTTTDGFHLSLTYTHHILHVLGHAAFGKRSNGGRRRQNKWLKKEMQPAAGEEN